MTHFRHSLPTASSAFAKPGAQALTRVNLFDANGNTMVSKIRRAPRPGAQTRHTEGEALVVWDLERAARRPVMTLDDCAAVIPVSSGRSASGKMTSLQKFGKVRRWIFPACSGWARVY